MNSNSLCRMLLVVALLLYVNALHANIGPKQQHSFTSREPGRFAIIGINGGCNLALHGSQQWVFGLSKGEGEKETAYEFFLNAGMDIQVLPRFAIAPVFSARYSWGNAYSQSVFPMFGVEYTAYTDFKSTNQVVRPVIGLQNSFAGAISYGYNFRVDNQPCLLATRHTIQLTVPIWIPYILFAE